jgi:hypothetical protein
LPVPVSIVGHCLLDPRRKTDPVSGLRAGGRTYDQLLADVVLEYQNCLNNNQNTLMRLFKNSSSNKVYALGQENKKHWIFNGETFTIGKEMGLWNDSVEVINDDSFAEGHTIVFLKK